jgi:hypothetical protein
VVKRRAHRRVFAGHPMIVGAKKRRAVWALESVKKTVRPTAQARARFSVCTSIF